MRLKILLGILVYLLLYVSVANANIYDATLDFAYDGDTVYLESELWPGLTQYIKLRIYGIDTPEIRTKQACQKALGLKAKAFITNYLSGKTLTISNISKDKYFGRVVGDLYADGILVSDIMLKQGFAVPYFGKKKTKVWC